MVYDNLLSQKILRANDKIEKEWNKIDEWLIPRDRSSFYLTNDFHPYFAAFPPLLVKKILEKYSQKEDIVFDPFMGGGSTIVESFTLKRNSIGNDISPLAELITHVKVTPLKISQNSVSQLLDVINKEIEHYNNIQYRNFPYSIPDITNIDKWFSPKSKYDLTILLTFINKIKNSDLKKFFLLAFSSIVRKVSNAKNAQQHLCIMKGKKIPLAFSLFESKVQLMTQQMDQYFNLYSGYRSYLPNLFSKDVRNISKVVSRESIDIVITSPPYGTGSHYTDINRLSFEWLGLPKPKRNETLETTKDFRGELKKSIEQIYTALKRKKYCFFVYGDPSNGNGLTKKAIDDAKDIGFLYEGLISCPIVKTKSNHHTKYRRYIPKDFILIFKRP